MPKATPRARSGNGSNLMRVRREAADLHPLRLLMLCGALALAPGAAAQSRGELLYSLHCIACHSTQMHWREQRLARDWASLQFQVRRWQATAQLGWNEADIAEVTRYLNDSIYRFAPP